MEDDNDCLLGSGMEYTFVDGDDSDGDCEFHHTALEVVVTDNNINAENLDGPDEEDDDDCLVVRITNMKENIAIVLHDFVLLNAD
eukprot:CAMPEP_0194226128 /NCGR_PEP_ID=MMETSP0156-20130528/41224_1 /TAXON_ID=33649 /ORGANISM="Thalassionema nitzschioides, Strain L26-B" /LENGTH=84 /DNA_ID=CAMNT_0038958373 /DNA_START=1013 /DNA_END=1268 /DNA_ORIENTATION=+